MSGPGFGGGGGGGGGGGFGPGGGEGGGGGSTFGGNNGGTGTNPFQSQTATESAFQYSTTAATTFLTSTTSASGTTTASQTTSTKSGTATAASETSSSSATAAATATGIDSDDSGATTKAAMIGGTLGALVLLMPLAFLLYRRWKRNQQHHKSIGGAGAGVSLLKPWKKKEMELKVQIQELQTTLDLRVPYDPKNPDHNAKPAPPPFPVNDRPRKPRSMSVDSGVSLRAVVGTWQQQTATENASAGQAQVRFADGTAPEPYMTPPVLDTSDTQSIHTPRTPPQPPTQRPAQQRYSGQIRPGMGVQRRNTGDSVRTPPSWDGTYL